MNDLTLISFNFNTPQVIYTMLASFVRHHGTGPHGLLLYENSTNDLSADMLKQYGVPFKRHHGKKHIDALEDMIKDCPTRYALVVDSDIIFRKSIESVFETFKKSTAALFGEVCGDRAGFKLHPRVHPWFMFIDMAQIRAAKIKFCDWKKVVQSHSEGFYKVPPIQADKEGTYYDVGATFYEDIKAAWLKIYDFKADPKYFYHFEAMSWAGLVHEKQAQEAMKYTLTVWSELTEKLLKVDISGAFK